MNPSRNRINRMIALSVSFTLVLLAARIIRTGELYYIFFAWNLFLAIIPFVVSNQLLKQRRMNFMSIVMLSCWLLFFPNAPYIITDIFHFKERPPIPFWYDLLLVTSAAWNGLILGIISLLQVEKFLHRYIRQRWVHLVVGCCLMLCSFGIYLGRFLRFNSWDIITDPLDLFHSITYRVFNPFSNLRTWGFTFLFGGLLWLVYFTIKHLSHSNRHEDLIPLNTGS
jgi:uncharacterized membrane protein